MHPKISKKTHATHPVMGPQDDESVFVKRSHDGMKSQKINTQTWRKHDILMYVFMMIWFIIRLG